MNHLNYIPHELTQANKVIRCYDINTHERSDGVRNRGIGDIIFCRLAESDFGQVVSEVNATIELLSK